ncbi:hypothetical protein QCA50_017799 [Cerrena zonata]|uniref:Uncharacterized protein n=1 Tax=Cerrena zonata TaxID=2478898 RepID=A0AAW0FEW4_9APHY
MSDDELDSVKVQKSRGDDETDIDEEPEGEDEEEPAEGQEMDQDGPRTPKKKKKPRKFEINLVALANEQEALATLASNEVLHLKLRKRYHAEALNFVR